MSLGATPRNGESFLVPRDHCRVQQAGLISLSMQPSIRVAVSSEERMLREILEASLASREGLQVVSLVSPDDGGGVDVLLVDARGNPLAALDRTWEARERWPEAKVIAVGLEQEDESIVAFIEAGAGGYVLKGSSPEDLEAAIHAAQQGLAPCSPVVVAAVLARIAALSRHVEPPPCAEVEPLTFREREILGLLATGLGNKEIGRRLKITLQTVKNHVHRILEKLRVHRRRDAVRLAYDLGILAEPKEPPGRSRFTEGERG